MKVLLLGHKGWLGQRMQRILEEHYIDVVTTDVRPDGDYQTFRKAVDELNPTHMVSFIERTYGKIGDNVYNTMDDLEQKGKLYENIRDNLYAPLIMSMVAQELDLHYTYLGTGCIFTYDEEHPEGDEKRGFRETDDANFFGSSYSIVKGFTDRIFRIGETSKVLQLRIHMPITSKMEPRNFITKMTQYEKVCSLPNSMSVMEDLLPMVVTLLRNKTTGTINLVNPGVITHDEILKMYQDIVDPSFTWKNFTVEDKILAAERSNNCMDTTELQTLFPSVRHIKDAVRETLLQMRRERYS